MKKSYFDITDSRITPLKEEVINFIETSDDPFSAQDILSYLESKNISANKTTIYRQLDSYLEDGLIQSVNLNDGVIRYELKQDHCHHHVVCTDCGKIEHIDLGNEISSLHLKLSTQTGIEIQEHMLEFFGVCEKCG